MNKKIYAVLLCICAGFLVLASASGLMAQEDPKLAAKRAALMQKAKQALTGREWIIYVTIKPATAKEAEVIETDALTFADRTVLSKNLSTQGYSKNGSNYSLWVADDGSFTWETMQLNEETQDIAFLKGEFRGSVMTGVIVYKPVKGEGATYYYTSQKEKPRAAAVTSTTTSTTTAATTETKQTEKKKGWGR